MRRIRDFTSPRLRFVNSQSFVGMTKLMTAHSIVWTTPDIVPTLAPLPNWLVKAGKLIDEGRLKKSTAILVGEWMAAGARYSSKMRRFPRSVTLNDS